MLANTVHNLNITLYPKAVGKGIPYLNIKTKSIIVLEKESNGVINSLNFLRTFWKDIGKAEEQNRVEEPTDSHRLRRDIWGIKRSSINLIKKKEFLKTENLVSKAGGRVGIKPERQEANEGKSLGSSLAFGLHCSW